MKSSQTLGAAYIEVFPNLHNFASETMRQLENIDFKSMGVWAGVKLSAGLSEGLVLDTSKTDWVGIVSIGATLAAAFGKNLLSSLIPALSGIGTALLPYVVLVAGALLVIASVVGLAALSWHYWSDEIKAAFD
ncbi:MAG: hypothetical protein FWE46_03765, partial [Coriobacteriia bacterium]|nr:hypothetical protein [Coriobacteriia bacterium]MCL2537394.1 hypothetical protein [Coriobacteriia bacterium]